MRKLNKYGRPKLTKKEAIEKRRLKKLGFSLAEINVKLGLNMLTAAGNDEIKPITGKPIVYVTPTPQPVKPIEPPKKTGEAVKPITPVPVKPVEARQKDDPVIDKKVVPLDKEKIVVKEKPNYTPLLVIGALVLIVIVSTTYSE